MKRLQLFFLIPVLFIGACVEEDCFLRVCEQADFETINSLLFVFDLDNTYTLDDIDSTQLIRFEKGTDFTETIDLHSFTEQFQQGDFQIVLSDSSPFIDNSIANLNDYDDYDYIIRSNAFEYKITDIEVKGEFSECNCVYTNTQKTFKLNGVEMERTNSNMQVVLD